MKINFSIILVLVLISSCNKKNDPYSPVYEKFPDFQIQRLNVESDPIYLSPNDYESFTFTSETFGTEYLLFTSDGDLYTVDKQQKTIRQHNSRTLEEIRSFSYIGSGPGEYQEIGAISTTSNQITILDRWKSKVIRFTNSFDFIDEIVVSGMHPEDNISTFDNSLIFHTRTNDKSLLGIMDFSDTTRTYFHNHVIPHRSQPAGYNKTRMHYDRGYLSLASANMPLIFIYEISSNSSKPIKLLRLNASYMEMIGKPMSFDAGFGSSLIANPPPVEMSLEPGRTIGNNPVFQRVWMSNPYLILHEVQNRSLIVLKHKNFSFTHLFNIKILDDDGLQVPWSDIQIKYPYIYVGVITENRILRFDISKLE